jgi:hypothetical protein
MWSAVTAFTVHNADLCTVRPPELACQSHTAAVNNNKNNVKTITQVTPRSELWSLDSECRVLTITPWGRRTFDLGIPKFPEDVITTSVRTEMRTVQSAAYKYNNVLPTVPGRGTSHTVTRICYVWVSSGTINKYTQCGRDSSRQNPRKSITDHHPITP